MKRKLKYLILLLIIGTIIGWIWYHQKDIKYVLIDSNEDFYQIESSFYVSKDTESTKIDSLRKWKEEAIYSLRNFWANLSAEPIIIYCNSKEQYDQLGVIGTPGCTRLGQYVVFRNYRHIDVVLAHELCHTELFSRIGGNYYTYYFQVPSWLDEGIALQFDNRSIYPREELETIPLLSMSDLKSIDKAQDFYLKDYQSTTYNYRCAKMEIERFLGKNKKEDLIKLVDDFENRTNFYKQYEQLKE